jgi:hypothetical protein
VDATETRKLREHIYDMKLRYENLQWDAKVMLTKAETIQAEYLRLESLVDKLDKPKE